jgi:bacterioferritin
MPNFIRDVEEIRERAIRNIEEGAVTEAYELEPEKVVSVLNEALATEIVCVLRYMHHYFMATGVHAKAVSAEFKEHADAEREHADEIAERIQQLGGKPDFNPRTLMERSAAQYVEGETLGDMIREDLIAERIVIDVYNQMIRYIGDKDPTTRVLLEHILGEEEEHASDLSDLLYIVEPSTGETEAVDPGVHPLRAQGEQQGKSSQSSSSEKRNESSQQIGNRQAASSSRKQQSASTASNEDVNDQEENEGAFATRGGMGGFTAKGQGENQGRNQSQRKSGSEGQGNVSQIQRDAREARPTAQTIADRQSGSERGGERKQQQGAQRNQGRDQGIANRQSSEQFAGRGSVNSGRNSSSKSGESAGRGEANRAQGEARPSRATASGRPNARNAQPEHEPGTTGRRRRQDEPATSIDRGDEGGMSGGTRAVRITNKQRKNRAA